MFDNNPLDLNSQANDQENSDKTQNQQNAVSAPVDTPDATDDIDAILTMFSDELTPSASAAIDPALRAEADANAVASAKHRKPIDPDVMKALADSLVTFDRIDAANGLKGFVAGKLEDAYALSPAERDEAIAELKSDEENLKALADARWDDETIHGADYWFGEDTIWNDMIGKTLWDSMVNRYPMALIYLLPHLMAAIVPTGVIIEKPLTESADEDSDPSRVAPTLWGMANADSGVGKGAIEIALKPLKDAILTLERENMDLLHSQRQSNARVNKERAKDNDPNPLDPINDAPGKMHPAIMIESFTVPALRSVIGSAEYWHDKADEFGLNFTGRGCVISATEGSQIIAELDLTNPKSPNVQSLCKFQSGENGGSTVRKQDFETVIITRPAVSLAFTLIPEQFQSVIATEALPGKTISGFSPRIVSIAGNKGRDAKTPGYKTVKSKKTRTVPKLHIQRDALVRAFKLMTMQLVEQGVIELSDNAYAAFGDYVSQVDLNALMNESFNSKYWEACVNKNPDNLVRLACAFALKRISGEVATGADCPVIEIDIIDFDRALSLLNLSLADRRYQLTQISTDIEQTAIVESTKRSLKQNEDTWFNIFSCPRATAAWIAEKKAAGKSIAQCQASVAGRVRKRMTTMYQIDVTTVIKSLWC